MQKKLDIFISHSSADESLASALVELLRKAPNIPATQIRCTSVPGYKIQLGANFDQVLKAECFSARFFIGLITPGSIESAYVLFELGARWGSDQKIAPILAGGASPSEHLPGPLSILQALSLDTEQDILQVLDDVAAGLGRSLDPPNAYLDQIRTLVSLSNKRAKTSHGGLESSALPTNRVASFNPTNKDKKILIILSQKFSPRYEIIFPQHISAIFGKNDTRCGKCDAKRKKLHSQMFGYRFMEALRNYAQHCGSAVHGLGLHFDHQASHGSEFAYHPWVSLDQLIADKKFSKKIIDEINQGAVHVDKNRNIELKPLVREYMQAIAEVHEAIRELVKPELRAWEKTLDNVIQRFSGENSDGSLAGLAAAKLRANGCLEDIIYVTEELSRRRKFLQTKNILAKNGKIRYVSSRPR